MTCRTQANALHDALKEVIQKAIYDKLITPREDSLMDEVYTKQWTLLIFMKDGRSFVTHGEQWVYDTKEFAEEICRMATENIENATSFLIEFVNSGIQPFFKDAFSHMFPIPVKE